MSIFSKLKNAKKAADKHKQGTKATQETQAIPPYKHVPTHAAIDALSGAPSSWQHSDRGSIRYQNTKRLSQMGMLRNSSGLSNATSINTVLNRNSSYNSAETFLGRESPLRPEVRKSQLGLQAIENWEKSRSYPQSHRISRQGKSPLASTPITPTETASNSSSSSSSQVLELPSSHTSRSFIGEPNLNFSRPSSRPETRVNFTQPLEDPQTSSNRQSHVAFSPDVQEFDFGQPGEEADSYFDRPVLDDAPPNVFDRVQTSQKRNVGEKPWERAAKVAAAKRLSAPVAPPPPKKSRLSFFGKKTVQIAAH